MGHEIFEPDPRGRPLSGGIGTRGRKLGPTLTIEWSNGTATDSLPLSNITWSPEAETVWWLLKSYCNLTWRNEDGQHIFDGQWNTSPILPLVDRVFRENRLNGTEHAWMFLYGKQVKLFGSSSVDDVEDLPDDRWASTSDYSVKEGFGANQTVKYEAELRYYMWFP